MSCVLYYSNFCKPSKELLITLSKTKVKDDIHFVCIDNRVKGKNNETYILLPNGEQLILPPTVKKVPALLLINHGYQVLFGSQILSHLNPQINKEVAQSTNNNMEPQSFNMCNFGSIHSDNYSFLDMTSEELSAKGSGGMRQLHNYATLDFNDTIETPPDTYTPDKIGEISLDKLQQQRNNDIPKQHRPF